MLIHTTTRLPEELVWKLEERAAREERQRSDVIRRLLEFGLRHMPETIPNMEPLP